MYYTIFYGTTFGMTFKLLGTILINDDFYKSAYIDLPLPSTMFGWFGCGLGLLTGAYVDFHIINNILYC
jgi:hypothetical protein